MPPEATDAPDTGTEGEPTSDPTTDPAPDPTPDKGTEDTTNWKAEAEKYKALSRKHEDRAKANAKAAKELDDFKKSQMTDNEKAVREAEERGRKEGAATSGQRLAMAEIKAALTGIVPDPKAVAEDLNLAKYLTEDGDVDHDAVQELKARYEALKQSFAPPKDDKNGGGLPGKPTEDLRGGGDPTQTVEETDPRKLAARVRRL